MLSGGALFILFLVGIKLREKEEKNIKNSGIILQLVVLVIFLSQTAIKLGYLPF